jgi:hypothetical protein
MPTQQTRLAPEQSRLVWSTLVVQLALVSVSFPITQLLTDAPLFYIDSPYHWYEMEVAKGLAAAGRSIGYDPFFAAGYVGGVTFNASAKIPAALCIMLSPWLSTAVTYKLYVFAAAVFGPACVPLAARWLNLSWTVSLVATVFAVVLWWCSALRYLHTAGLVSFVFATHLALAYTALVIRYLSEPMRWPFLVLLALAGAAGMTLHPFFPLLVAPLLVALTWANWRKIDSKRLLLTYALLPVICLLPNLLWILPSLRYPSFASGVTQPYQHAIGISIIWDEALGRITQEARGSRLNIVLWFVVLWAFASRVELPTKRITIAVTLASVGLIVFAAFGAIVSSPIQPNRFSSAAYLYLCIPAGVGAVAVFENLSFRNIRRLAAAGSAVLLLVAAMFFARELEREVSYADIPHHGERPPEVRGVGKDSAWILAWLKKNTTPDARVLFEASKARIHDEAHMAGYYALTADREFVGGPYPYLFFAGYWDGYLFSRPIESFSQRELADYLRLYNIGWIVVFSDTSKQFFDGMSGLTPLDQFGPIQTYAVTGPHSFFLEGSGAVTGRSFNRIELSQLSGPSVVLKYHFVPGLESIPPARLEPTSMPGDPQPFVRVFDPPPHLVLQMR